MGVLPVSTVMRVDVSWVAMTVEVKRIREWVWGRGGSRRHCVWKPIGLQDVLVEAVGALVRLGGHEGGSTGSLNGDTQSGWGREETGFTLV